MGVPPKSSISIGFSRINHPLLGTPIYGSPDMFMLIPPSCLSYASKAFVANSNDSNRKNLGTVPQMDYLDDAGSWIAGSKSKMICKWDIYTIYHRNVTKKAEGISQSRQKIPQAMPSDPQLVQNTFQHLRIQNGGPARSISQHHFAATYGAFLKWGSPRPWVSILDMAIFDVSGYPPFLGNHLYIHVYWVY